MAPDAQRARLQAKIAAANAPHPLLSKGALYAYLFATFVGILIYVGNSMQPPQPSNAAARAPRETVINSAWDGSVNQVERYLKRQLLRDPESFQAIEWSPVVKTQYGYSVRVKYRAKNGFGGYSVANQVFELDSYGAVVGVRELE